jgi:CheY-like chemotaxis protein
MVTASSRQNALPLGSTILLVESDPDNRAMYADCLRQFGFAVLTADTTDEGLRCASNADVVVTEIRVSGSFDGLDLVSRLRSADKTKLTPIIVLTACTFEPEQLRRAYAAGCDVFLSKPSLPENLLSAISGVVATT